MKIWIATGGTGGHIFPALSILDYLESRGHKLTVSSDYRGFGMVKRNKSKKTRLAFVWASGVGGKNRFRQLFSLSKIGLSAFALILRFMLFRPDRVVAFGGYASVPVILAASVWKVPIFLHEQNAAIGRANKYALRWVNVLMTSFPNVEGFESYDSLKVVYTGLPVRKEFLAAAKSPLGLGGNILVTGGSLGAKIVDDVVPKALVAMNNKKIFVMHQTRPENVAKLQKYYADNKIHANVLSFINDMCAAIVSADLIIGRSGASTVVELQTIGRPAVFVPLGINPDQKANAKSFSDQGGGLVIEEKNFTARHLSSVVSELFSNPARLKKMAEKALIKNEAIKNICQEILK